MATHVGGGEQGTGVGAGHGRVRRRVRGRYHALFGGPEVPVPVEAIAEDLLGLTLHESYELEFSGMLIPSKREIWINAAEREYAGRPRFTLAHELGHWIHHVIGSRDAAPVYCRASDVRPENGAADFERDANVFAAELLMPEPDVRAQWERTPAIEAVAEAFAVSPLAMHWRLFNFNLVDARPT